MAGGSAMSAEPITLWDPDKLSEIRKAVFGSAPGLSRNGAARAGLNSSAGNQFDLIGFRRTDADRRPATPVIRPNDGPGDPARREALAAELRTKALRKGGPRDAALSPAMQAAVDAVKAGRHEVGAIGQHMGVSYSAAADRLAKACALKLLERRGKSPVQYFLPTGEA